MPNREVRRDHWWVDTGRKMFWDALRRPRHFWLGNPFGALSTDLRAGLIDAQVEATRPAISAAVGFGGVILLLASLLEAARATPGIGYGPLWTLAAGCGVLAVAVAVWRLQAWRVRAALVLGATALTGMVLSVPPHEIAGEVHARIGLFHLVPITLLALLVRPLATWLLVAVVVLVSLLRVELGGSPPGGLWMYWLYITANIAFGLMLRGYRAGFAMDAYRVRHQLWAQANTDALTGVYNRAGWNRLVAEHYQVASATQRPVSLVFFDVDNFKRINDTWGHKHGDEVLQALGRALVARQDEHTWAARMGGEEFVVLLVDATPEAVERFCSRVSEEFAQATGEIVATLSAGVAHRRPGETMAQQLKRADMALYQAKHLGRDRVEVDGSEGAGI